MKFRAVVAIVAFLVTGASAWAQDSTADLAYAPKVRHRVRVKFPGDATKNQGKYSFEYALDQSDEFKALTELKTFAASEQIKFTWPRLNPLRMRVIASESLAVDPNAKQLADFVDALLKLPGIVAPKAQSSALSQCRGNATFADNLELLRDAVDAGASIDKTLAAWIVELDTPGAASSRKVIGLISAQANLLKAKAAAARKLIEQSQERADTLSTTPLGSADGSTPSAPAAPPSPAPGAKPTPESLKAGSIAPPVKAGEKPAPSGNTPAPAPPKEPAPQAATEGAWCDDIRTLWRAIKAVLDIDNPIRRVVELEQLVVALNNLQAELKPFADEANWEGSDYVFFSREPVADQIRKIEIKAVRIDRPVNEVTHVIGLSEAQTTTGTLQLRRYARLVPEMAAGFVTSTVRRPKYGTATNAAGQTVVARKPEEDVSFSGALLLNAVFASQSESFALPMLQLGVSVAPDGPGIMAGLGLRLTRPKRVALSVGAILAWVKDLQTLRVDGPVSGTTAIDADLAYEPTVKPYFALQFKF
jgi:hypothetical protein